MEESQGQAEATRRQASQPAESKKQLARPSEPLTLWTQELKKCLWFQATGFWGWGWFATRLIIKRASRCALSWHA